MTENTEEPRTATERRLHELGVREPREIPKDQRIDWVYDTEGIGD